MKSAKADDGTSKKYKNVFERTEADSKVVEVWTEPKVGAMETLSLAGTAHD